MDDLIDGTVDGWPCSVTLMRNPGEKWVGVHAAAYTDEDDNSAPHETYLRIETINGDFPDRRSAMRFIKKLGFVPS